MSAKILYLPPNDRPDILAPGRGGGGVPLFTEMHNFAHGPVIGWHPSGGGEPPYWRRALLLSDESGPIAEGVNRAREVLARVEGIRREKRAALAKGASNADR